MIVGGHEARTGTDGAVDIDYCTAPPTEEVMMIVIDPVFVPGR